MSALVEGQRRPTRWPRRRGRSRRGSPCASRRRGGSPSPARAAATAEATACRAGWRARPLRLGGEIVLLIALRNLPAARGGRPAPVRMDAPWPPPARDRSSRARPVYPAGSRVNERGHLEVGGCDVVDLAAEFGTPAYIYAEDDIRARARSYLDAFRARSEDFEVLYASKAAPITAIYRLFAEQGLSVDVASGGELHMALRAGFDPGAHLPARQQQDRGRASLRGRGRGGPRDRRFLRRDRPPRPDARPAAGRPDPGHPGDPALHPLLRADRRPRLEVRVRPRGRAGGPGGRRGARLAKPAPGRPARPHRLADLRARALRGGDRGARRAGRRGMGVPHPQRRRRAGDRLHRGRRATLDRGLRRGQGPRGGARLRPACRGS